MLGKRRYEIVGGDMMDEEQYRAAIVEKYHGHFDHCYRLHQFVQAALQNNKWFTKNHHDAALLYIRPRAFKAFDSVRRLCEVALCEDAAVVLRCLVNLRAVARWISLVDPEKRSKKYLGWYWSERHARAMERPEKFSSVEIANIQEHFNIERAQFEFTNKKGKVCFAKTWYQPEALLISELFEQAGMEYAYENVYKPLSATEHSVKSNLKVVCDDRVALDFKFCFPVHHLGVGKHPQVSHDVSDDPK